MSFADNNLNIGFIGAGNMASAIIVGLVKAGWPASNVMASNPSAPKLENLQAMTSIQTTHDNQQVTEFADILVLAVKPQKLMDVCSKLRSVNLSEKLIISVAAGFPSARISSALQQDLAIVRAMPNTPSHISEGATGLYATEKVSEPNKAITQEIFNAIGQSNWIASENLMDTVTAIAGSSPAYFFLMMEAMIKAAEDSGMPQETAFDLVTQAMKGAASLAQNTREKPLEQLRKEVTSPGGTTAAAISSFKTDHFEDTVIKAVKASINRGKELGKLN